MYILDIEKLCDGDIILKKGEPRAQEIMQSEYTHAILNVSKSSCIESDGYGVQSFNPQRRLFNNEDDILVLRLKPNIRNRAFVIEKAIDKARSFVGTAYGTGEARKVITGRQEDINLNRQFCTRLVSQSYNYGGLDLVENVNYPSPKEIVNSLMLNVVGKLLIKATEKEIEYAKTESVLDKQTEATNELLAMARELSGSDIQTLEQIVEYLIDSNDSDFDKKISEFFINSDYYKLWEVDCENNSQYYDYNLFNTIYDTTERKLKAISLISDTYENLHKIYSINKASYINLYKQYGFEYFNLNIDLYSKLLELNEVRKDITLKTIQEFNLI